MDRVHPNRARCFTGRKPHRINSYAATQTESMFCRSHARQNHIFTHNPNPVSSLSSSPMQSTSCPAFSQQSHDSKPLTTKLFIMYVLPVTATGQSTYTPIPAKGGWQGEGANTRRTKCEKTRSLSRPRAGALLARCGLLRWHIHGQCLGSSAGIAGLREFCSGSWSRRTTLSKDLFTWMRPL